MELTQSFQQLIEGPDEHSPKHDPEHVSLEHLRGRAVNGEEEAAHINQRSKVENETVYCTHTKVLKEVQVQLFTACRPLTRRRGYEDRFLHIVVNWTREEKRIGRDGDMQGEMTYRP